MRIDPNIKRDILIAVDTALPAGSESIWLTGSRVRGDTRPNSDWDVIAFHPDAPRELNELFCANRILHFSGGVIELVFAHPSHWNDTRPYVVELRKIGVRLR